MARTALGPDTLRKYGRHSRSGNRFGATMAYQFITHAVADRIATITVNRPDKLNALNDATIGELGKAIDDARKDENVGGVIVTGSGRAFVAGADIAELQSKKPREALAMARNGQEI